MTRDNVVPFNPLDKRHLGESVAQAMLRQPTVPMAKIENFDGAGIYAIYYHGSFPAYKLLSSRNKEGQCKAPIYIGKAVPKGARKGKDLSANPGRVLLSRLLQHLRSIEEATNLSVEDFSCRYLVVDDIWIPLGESLLIARFAPIWNSLIDGFGNHDPGKGRHAGLRPRWDVLHPGRSWADKCQPRYESPEQIETEALEFQRNNPPHE
jgi:hypothetical protein